MNRPQVFPAPIYVTRPLTPPLEEYTTLLKSIWTSQWFTNNGPLHERLEKELAAFLGARHLSLFNNGTIALIVACQALKLTGEVITTPFTFPATPHVLHWNRLTPVFADIHPETMNIDPARIEPLIGPRTSAILAVHVYGTPCAVGAIEALAHKHGLRVIYDAAHAFGAKIGNTPVGAYGDITMLSFHATKLFHTAEGGALIAHDSRLKARIDLLKNFGIKNEAEVILPGINGKMSEPHAALGLLNLRYYAAEWQRRARIRERYNSRLGSVLRTPPMLRDEELHESQQYYVVRIARETTGVSADEVHERLKTFNIWTRRYFSPLCSKYDCYSNLPSADAKSLPVAHRVAEEVLALPFYGQLSDDDVERICDAIEYVLHNK
jgi:dTDP-4-amino-4,6-dideoxygalactose transaminase